MWYKPVVSQFNEGFPPPHLPGETKEQYGPPLLGQPIFKPRFEPGTSQIRKKLILAFRSKVRSLPDRQFDFSNVSQ